MKDLRAPVRLRFILVIFPLARVRLPFSTRRTGPTTDKPRVGVFTIELDLVGSCEGRVNIDSISTLSSSLSAMNRSGSNVSASLKLSSCNENLRGTSLYTWLIHSGIEDGMAAGAGPADLLTPGSPDDPISKIESDTWLGA